MSLQHFAVSPKAATCQCRFSGLKLTSYEVYFRVAPCGTTKTLPAEYLRFSMNAGEEGFALLATHLYRTASLDLNCLDAL